MGMVNYARHIMFEVWPLMTGWWTCAVERTAANDEAYGEKSA
jgi:hypothetical protein